MEKKTTVYTELIKVIVMGILASLPALCLWLYTASFPMAYGDDEYAYYRWNHDITAGPQERYYDTVILGDSSANAVYLPEYLSEGTINLSLGGTTAAENYYVLSNWLETHDAPKTVYLSFMDYHMLYDNMFYERTVYSHLLRPEQEREILKEAIACGEENIAVPDARMRLFCYDHCLLNYYLPALLNSGFNGRLASNQTNYDSIMQHRGAYIGLTTDMYHDTDPNIYDSYEVNELFDRYYRRLLDLCAEHSIRVRIVSLPKTGNSVLTEGYRASRDGYYRALAAEYTEVTYDAYTDTLPQKYYHDWEHFNIYGAAEWSKLIKDRYPGDFANAPVSELTRQGVADYISRAADAAGLLSLCDGKTAAAVAVTNHELDLLKGFTDTGLITEDRKVYVQNKADITVHVQEAASEPNGFCIWTEPDGENAIVSGETVYSVRIDPYADLTLIVIDTASHQPYARNYILTGDGLIGQ